MEVNYDMKAITTHLMCSEGIRFMHCLRNGRTPT